jgi:adenylosuccinate synthase
MPVRAVVGANWGDEGKGKICDALAVDADVVVRFQGGRNAGHTIVNDRGRFALHLLPSGVFHDGVVNVLGPGVAVDPPALVAELDGLTQRGLPAPDLRISDRAQVVLPTHRLADGYEEERLGGSAFGSTRVGIAPFYADKYLKVGVQMGDLFDEAWLRQRVESSLAGRNVLFRHLYGKQECTVDGLLTELKPALERLAPLVCDTTVLLHERLAAGARIVVEGQLGALRDPDHGIYPYSTSSSTLAGYATVGAGIPPGAIDEVLVVAKAYSSCVGAGPFVTEWEGDAAAQLRQRGGDRGEFGATTGRPRRVGPFDAVATRYGCRLQGATAVALSNLDVLGYLDEIPVCTAYRIDAETTTDFPRTRDLARAEPVYETLPGWRDDIRAVRRWQDLPESARRYVERLETLIEAPLGMISVGPHRDALIHRQ